METLISSSLLGCDLSSISEELAKAENAGIDWIHYDVMDGVFVKNITFGEPLLKSIRRKIHIPVDVHLMIIDPVRYIDNYVDLNADIITFHFEAAENPQEVIDKIHSRGLKAGISICPQTKVDEIAELIPQVELVLVMTVNPGFGGQVFLPETLDKVKEVRNIINKQDKHINLEVDGGVNEKTAAMCREAGADVLVSGSFVFNAQDMAQAVEQVRGNTKENVNQ